MCLERFYLKVIKKEEPIRIAVVMGKYVTGGIKSVIFNYYCAMDKEKVQFDLFVDKNSSNGDYSEFTSQGAKVFEITPIRKNPIRNINDTRKVLKTENYKIVHGYLNTLNVFPMFAGFLAGTKIRISENLSTAHPKEPKTFLKNILKPFGRMFATDLAANSKYAGSWLFGENELNNIKILRNGLNLKKFCYDPKLRKAKRKELNISDDIFVVGHIGRYEFQKNHSFLIDVFQKVLEMNSSAKLFLIGYGELIEEIWQKIRAYDLDEYVIDGGESTDNVANYNAMDCFVMPSYYEGLPVVGIEAQATGLPCVFSTEVTKEAAITESVSFLSLDESASVWASNVLKFKSCHRSDNEKQLTMHGYNIVNESNNLYCFYKKLMK